MDNAEMSGAHWRALALITAGLFFDLVDLAIFGGLVPDMIKDQFLTLGNVPFVVTGVLLGLFFGSAGQGETRRPLRSQDGLSMESTTLRFRHHRLRLFAELLLVGRVAFHRRVRAGHRDCSGLCLRRRVLAKKCAWPQHVAGASRRRRAALARGDQFLRLSSGTRSAGAAFSC